MEYQIEDLGDARRKYRFEVPAERVDTALNKAFREIRGGVRMRGFRPGRVPLSIVRKRFGSRVRRDVALELIQEVWGEVAEEQQVLGRPEVDHEDIEAGKPFTFEISCDVIPEVTASDYVGVEVEYPEIEVTDDEVEAQLERRLQGAAKVVEASEDHEVAEGDTVITELTLSDEEGEKASEAGTSIQVGEELFYPGLDRFMLGMKKDETRTGTVHIDDRAFNEEIADKDLEARVKVLSIQITRVPDLTDEVARELGYEGGEQEMRDRVRSELISRRENLAQEAASTALLRKLVDRHDFEVPQALVDNRYELLVEEAKALHTYQGKDPKSFSVAPERAEAMAAEARYRVQATLLLEAVARQESIEITDQDLQGAYQRIADERGQTVEAIRGYFVREDAEEMLRGRLLEQKALEWLFERAERVPPSTDPADESAVEPDSESLPEGGEAGEE